MAPKSDSKFNDQIAELATRLFSSGGLAFGAGGIGACWFFFLESDMPKAITSAIVGVVLAYGSRLIKPFHEGNLGRADQVGEQFEQFVRARGLQNKYLQSQALACASDQPKGIRQYDSIFIPLLEEVFVPLELDFSATQAGFNPWTELYKSTKMPLDNLDIWHFMAKASTEPAFRQLAILAWGGYGKTTLLKHVAYIYGTKKYKQHKGVPARLPVLLVLRQIQEVLSQSSPPDLIELILKHHLPKLPKGEDIQMPESWIKRRLHKGKVVVMFDGFDEVSHSRRPLIARWINDQMHRYPEAVFIVTSRPKAYRGQGPAGLLALNTQLWVKDFQEQQRQKFVQRWYNCQERYLHGGRWTPDIQQEAQQSAAILLAQIEDQQELKDLAKNPLLLNMIVRFHRQAPNKNLPKRRVQLYQAICQLQLRDRPEARGLDTVLVKLDAQSILQPLALEMMQQQVWLIKRSKLLPFLETTLAEQEESLAPQSFLDEVVQISELIIEQEDEYEFSHLSFQEYLAAKYIAEQPQDRESLLYDHLGDDRWKSTILLYAAQAKQPSALIREALRRDAEDLAYICWQETTKQIDAELVRTLKVRGQPRPTNLAHNLRTLKTEVEESRYQKLADYLHNGEWQKANHETYRLMITAVGKEEGQGFSRAQLFNIPCDTLLVVDNLWVKYSQGQFGFSTQKDIYLNQCGGITDGEYHKEIWDQFCEINGWKINGSYVDVTWSREAPIGHLPIICCFGVIGWCGCSGVFLFSHIQTCQV